MYCEHCGLQILPKRPVCTRCGASPTHHWFQLMSLVTLTVAVICNSAVGWFVLPRLAAGPHPKFLFRAWLWTSQNGSLYGWVPLALGLLAWDYFVWKTDRPRIRGWVTRKMLIFVLATGIAPMIPWWIPAGQPSDRFLSTLARYPGLPSLFSWGLVLSVALLLCLSSETRDLLLGRGRALSLVSLGVLIALLALTVVGWSLT